MRSWAYNCFGVLMGTSWRASCPRWPSFMGDSSPMITLFPSQGDFCATASGDTLQSASHTPATAAAETHTAPGLAATQRDAQPASALPRPWRSSPDRVCNADRGGWPDAGDRARLRGWRG